MDRHLHLVPGGADRSDGIDSGTEVGTHSPETTNVVDLEQERRRRRRYHPSAGQAWLDELFDDDPLDPVC